MYQILLTYIIFFIMAAASPLTPRGTATQTQLALPYAIGNVTLSNGIEVFYREAGSPSNPTVLLLHGFPSSSHQFRNLIPLLSTDYHVVAPDYPGFGFTVVPDSLNFTYTFDNLAATIGSFLDVKNITTFTPYVFDYGAPVGFRLAVQRPQAVSAIISQNGNAYVEGFGQDAWAPIFALWNASTPAEIQQARDTISNAVLTFEGVRSQYVHGSSDPNQIEPESYWLDWTLIDSRPGNKDVQLDLFRDYATNVAAYPAWQAYLRQHKPRLLAAWGKNDAFFIPPGAEAFKRDVPDAQVVFLDAGHFLLETNLVEMATYVLEFLKGVYV